MSGLGTIVNVAAILGGCVIGLLVKGGLPKHLEDTITSGGGAVRDLCGDAPGR